MGLVSRTVPLGWWPAVGAIGQRRRGHGPEENGAQDRGAQAGDYDYNPLGLPAVVAATVLLPQALGALARGGALRPRRRVVVAGALLVLAAWALQLARTIG